MPLTTEIQLPTGIDMETIISGSRQITDFRIVEAAVLASGFTITKVIEGGQRSYKGYPKAKIVGGVDWLAHQWGKGHYLEVHTEYALWDVHGKAAGPIRNRKMAALGKQLIAIPDPESRGTVDMIEAAREAGYPSERIFVYYDPDLFPEGPTGCLDDGDELSQALQGMPHQDLNRILKENL